MPFLQLVNIAFNPYKSNMTDTSLVITALNSRKGHCTMMFLRSKSEIQVWKVNADMLCQSTDFLITNNILELAQRTYYSLFHEFLKRPAWRATRDCRDAIILTLLGRQAKDTSQALHLHKWDCQHISILEISKHYVTTLCTDSTFEIFERWSMEDF